MVCFFDRFHTLAPTTVISPIERKARADVYQLLRLLHDQPTDLLTLLSTELVIWKSRGCKSLEY